MKEIVYSSVLTAAEKAQADEIAKELNLLPETAGLLFSRGYRTSDAARRFLSPGKKNFNDPFLLKGMRETAERLKQARDLGETVLVYGDYDADGVSAGTILYRALTEYGVNAINAMPERADGYGLNEDIVAEYAEEYFIDLVITVDCGISDRDCVEFIKNELGADVIVTDHHEIPDVIPDTVVVNPKLPEQDYPFDGLCGAGVALKVAYALLGDGADKYLDIAALATVADSMPLIGENRDIVYEGLKIFNSNRLRPQYKALLSAAANKEVTAQTLAFTVAPRINAAGRMGDAHSALKLFLSDDETEIFELAARLSAYNMERQAECDRLYKSAKEKLNAEGAYRNAIMLYDESWKTGFVGIVAARLAEEYYRPVIMFAGAGDNLKGSARSIEGVNIFGAISANKDLLVEFGGHSQAAGVAVTKENFGAFYNAVDKYLGENYGADVFVPKAYAESEIKGKFSMKFAEEIELFEPSGVGNRKPLFVTEVLNADAAPIKPYSPHVVFRTEAIDMIYFGGDKQLGLLNMPVKKQIVFEPNISVFNRQKSLKGLVREVLPRFDAEGLDGYVLERQLLALAADECEAEDFSSFTRCDCRYGTAYVFADPANIKNFPFLRGLEASLFSPAATNLANAVVIAPAENLDGYENVVYMDLPPRVVAAGKHTYINKTLDGRGLFRGLSVARADFAAVFALLKSLVGRRFTSAADFYRANGLKCDEKQFIFAARVFIELGIFVVSDGVLRLDGSVRSELKNSLIYIRTEEILSDV